MEDKRITNLRKRLKNIPNMINKRLKKTWEGLSEPLVHSIKQRMEDGKGQTSQTGGKSRMYKKLKPSTIKGRRKLEEEGKLSDRTLPGLSNQLQSGKLIDSIEAKVTNKTLTISPTGDRAEIAEYQEDKGRPTFYLNNEEIDMVEEALLDMAEQTVLDAIDEVFKKK